MRAERATVNGPLAVRIDSPGESTMLARDINASLVMTLDEGQPGLTLNVVIDHEPWEIVMFHLQRSEAPVAKLLSSALCAQVSINNVADIPRNIWEQALKEFEKRVAHNFEAALNLAKEWVDEVVGQDYENRMQQALLAHGMTPEQLAKLLSEALAPGAHDNVVEELNLTLQRLHKQMDVNGLGQTEMRP